MNLSWDFLLRLRERGRDAAENWLRQGAPDSANVPLSRLAALDAVLQAQKRPLRSLIGGKWSRIVAQQRNKPWPKRMRKPAEFSRPSLPPRPFSA